MNKILLGFAVEGPEYIVDLALSIKELKKELQLIKISNLYEYTPEEFERGSGATHLSVVALFLFDGKPEEVPRKLFEIKKKTLSGTLSSVFLLHNAYFSMNPSLVLPSQELHSKAHWLIPAAEVFGDFEHPVLKEPLRDLAQRFNQSSWGRFYAQGQSLLDFSSQEK